MTNIILRDRFPQYEIGRGSYSDTTLAILNWGAPATLRIGAYCSIGSKVIIFLGGEHRTDWVTTYPLLHKIGHATTKGDVVIGNDVWIGYGATILSGVTIGDGAVVGCRAVVARDIQPYEIAVGSPIRILRKRFSDEIIQRLLAVRWWDFPEKVVMQYADLLMSADIEECVVRLEDERRRLDE